MENTSFKNGTIFWYTDGSGTQEGSKAVVVAVLTILQIRFFLGPFLLSVQFQTFNGKNWMHWRLDGIPVPLLSTVVLCRYSLKYLTLEVSVSVHFPHSVFSSTFSTSQKVALDIGSLLYTSIVWVQSQVSDLSGSQYLFIVDAQYTFS